MLTHCVAHDENTAQPPQSVEADKIVINCKVEQLRNGIEKHEGTGNGSDRSDGRKRSPETIEDDSNESVELRAVEFMHIVVVQAELVQPTKSKDGSCD